MFISNNLSHTNFSKNDIFKFESLYIKGSPNECWTWKGSSDSDGYGNFSAHLKKYKAHRVSYVIYKKTSIEKGKLVLHSCDNPSCVNPAHLSKGTVQDNSDDMKLKNRQASGEKNAKSKLNENTVFDILYLYYFGNMNTIDLETRFKINSNQIGNIVKGKNWKNVFKIFMEQYEYPKLPNYYDGVFSGERNGRALLKEKDVYEILKLLYIDKVTKKEICKTYNVKIHVIRCIYRGVSWKSTFNKFMKDYNL